MASAGLVSSLGRTGVELGPDVGEPWRFFTGQATTVLRALAAKGVPIA